MPCVETPVFAVRPRVHALHLNEGRGVNEDQAKGKAKQAEGEAQETWGDAKDKAGDAMEDIKDKANDLKDDAGDMLDRDEEDKAEQGTRSY